MRFTVSFFGEIHSAVRIQVPGISVGYKFVQWVRDKFQNPYIDIDYINTDKGWYYSTETVFLEVPKKIYANCKLFADTQHMYIKVLGKYRLNRFYECDIKYEDGEYITEVRLNQEALLEKWQEDGCPTVWELEEKVVKKLWE